VQALSHQEIHLWRGTLDHPPSELRRFEKLLSADELATVNRFKFPVHRARFISGRGMLRTILAPYADRKPVDLRFDYSEFGKPHLRDPQNLHFSVAHSENHFLVALASRPVGVDVEVTRRLDLEVESLADQVFSNAELEAWRFVPHDQRQQAFVALWTRKEALLKGIGLGIAHHVKDVSVFFTDAAEPQIPLRLAQEKWSLKTLEDYAVVHSLAIAGELPEVIEKNFEWR
jgi:4'-phosphopantetheinyl transferase